MTLNCKTTDLKKGSTGEEVKELQTILKEKGYYDGNIDGEYGDYTVQAVKLLQRAQGNSTDGEFGPKTCAKLNQTTTTTTTTSNTSSTTASTSNTNASNKKFMKADILTAAETYRKHIKNNNNYPNYIEIPDSTGTKYQVSKALYMGLFEGVNMFAIKNGRLPNYVTASSTANNPLCIDYQNNSVNCGPTSLSMCLQLYAEYVSEPTLATACNTGSSGTSPSDLKKGAQKYGYDLVEINRNSTSVQASLDKCRPVLMHIHTSYAGGKSCLGYRGAYGHYIVCYGMNNGKYLLADPTKGFKTCNSTSIDNARSSTNMKYYSVVIK